MFLSIRLPILASISRIGAVGEEEAKAGSVCCTTCMKRKSAMQRESSSCGSMLLMLGSQGPRPGIERGAALVEGAGGGCEGWRWGGGGFEGVGAGGGCPAFDCVRCGMSGLLEDGRAFWAQTGAPSRRGRFRGGAELLLSSILTVGVGDGPRAGFVSGGGCGGC